MYVILNIIYFVSGSSKCTKRYPTYTPNNSEVSASSNTSGTNITTAAVFWNIVGPGTGV
jgi:hypothetical protein